MSEFDPYAIFMREIREADRKRFRIVSWSLNYSALDALAAHPITGHNFESKPLLEREFFGIPLSLDKDDRSAEPSLRSLFEKHGRSTLRYEPDYEIMHGRAYDRWLDAGLEALKEMRNG